MNCPKCKAAMELVVFDGIEVDRCTGCKGIWFDSREDEKLRARAGSESLDVGDPAAGKVYNEMRRVQCPRCTTRMVRLVDPAHPSLWYESCPVCNGVFLDAGEFRGSKGSSLVDSVKRLFGGRR